MTSCTEGTRWSSGAKGVNNGDEGAEELQWQRGGQIA